MKPLFKYAGIGASVLLIAFGVGSLIMGISGRNEVRDNIARENIVGTPDMAASVADKPVTTGGQAKDFADGIRKHTLEATGGQTYAEMGRFMTPSGEPTNDENAAAKQNGEPVENEARNIWITSTALTTALNTSFFAENVATFAIVMGIAMLLTGIGFLVLVLQIPARARTGAAPPVSTASTPASV
jgi:hypothetical protein